MNGRGGGGGRGRRGRGNARSGRGRGRGQAYVTLDKKGTKQLLVQCQNALYGLNPFTNNYKTQVRQ